MTTDFLNSLKENISLEKLEYDAKNIISSSDRSDLISYPEFVDFFKKNNTITKHDLVIGINFTYGWMPTMFDFRSTEFDMVLRILNDAKVGKIPTEDDLQILKRCFNNSLVGTSKLLHFINPNEFAIWDSRVYRYLTNERPYSYRLEDFTTFLGFRDFCKHITEQTDYGLIHELVEDKIYPMSKMRTVELIMFTNGK